MRGISNIPVLFCLLFSIAAMGCQGNKDRDKKILELERKLDSLENSKNKENPNNSTIAADETEPSIVKIKGMEWDRQNLRVKKFRNGDLIPQAKTSEEWIKYAYSKKPAWCYFEFDPSTEEELGLIYNGWVVLDKRNIAPDGWRVPESKDFKILTDNNNSITLINLRSKDGWDNESQEYNSDNRFGFNAKASGCIEGENAKFCSENSYGYYWSQSIFDSIYFNQYIMAKNPEREGWYPEVEALFLCAGRHNNYRTLHTPIFGCAIRLVKQNN
jgi:uncharacterized protein (TIGR02145 family)